MSMDLQELKLKIRHKIPRTHQN